MENKYKSIKILLLGIFLSTSLFIMNTTSVSASCGGSGPFWDFYEADGVYRGRIAGRSKIGEITSIGDDGSESLDELYSRRFQIKEVIKGDQSIGDVITIKDSGYNKVSYFFSNTFDSEIGDEALVVLSLDDDGAYVGASFKRREECSRDIIIDSEYHDLDNLIENNFTNPFSDSKDSVYYPYILNNYFDGIEIGYQSAFRDADSAAYKPDQDITRIEFVNMLARAFEIEVKVDEDTKFTDLEQYRRVSEDGTVLFTSGFKYAFAFKDLGLISGYSDGEFKPRNNITRGEASKILINIMKYKGVINEDGEYSYDFSDVTKQNKFGEYIAILNTLEVNGEKIVKGYSDGEFKTENNITRGQAAKVVDLARKY